MNRLGDDHDTHVVGFERMSDKTHDAVCAWATSENTMSGLIAKCGLNFGDYILHQGECMTVDIGKDENFCAPESIDLRLKGMVSYDKLRVIQDMITGSEKNDLLRDPRKYKTDLGSNRANIKDLREFKELNSDIVEIHHKLIHYGDVLSHIQGTTKDELKAILRRYHIDYLTISKVINFLIEGSKYIVYVKDSDDVYRMYLKPKCNYLVQGPIEWISQTRYL